MALWQGGHCTRRGVISELLTVRGSVSCWLSYQITSFLVAEPKLQLCGPEVQRGQLSGNQVWAPRSAWRTRGEPSAALRSVGGAGRGLPALLRFNLQSHLFTHPLLVPLGLSRVPPTAGGPSSSVVRSGDEQFQLFATGPSRFRGVTVGFIRRNTYLVFVLFLARKNPGNFLG